MKKPSLVVFIFVVIGITVSFIWAWQRYFRRETTELLRFTVERKDLEELVRVRGEIAPQADFNLEFPFAGTVGRIFVAEDSVVGQDAPLAALDTTDAELERQRLADARSAYRDALFDALHNAYTKSDDAVRNYADKLFENPRTQSPGVNLSNIELDTKRSIDLQRRQVEAMLDEWQTALTGLTVGGDLPAYAASGRANLYQIKTFLDLLAFAANDPNTVQIVSGTPSGEVPETWKTAVATARSSVNTAIASVTTALQSLTDTENQIAITDEKIRKSTLRAPESAQVAKIWFERGEEFRPGAPAITLYALLRKIQADISEVEIGKIRALGGNEVRIAFDAFPGEAFRGRVTSIDPKEVVKDGDVYYRANISLDPRGFAVRSGMSADLEIVTAMKRAVLTIPALAVSERDGAKYAEIEQNGAIVEREVTTGISDGESIEITNGLDEGATVVVRAD